MDPRYALKFNKFKQGGKELPLYYGLKRESCMMKNKKKWKDKTIQESGQAKYLEVGDKIKIHDMYLYHNYGFAHRLLLEDE